MRARVFTHRSDDGGIPSRFLVCILFSHHECVDPSPTCFPVRVAVGCVLLECARWCETAGSRVYQQDLDCAEEVRFVEVDLIWDPIGCSAVELDVERLPGHL